MRGLSHPLRRVPVCLINHVYAPGLRAAGSWLVHTPDALPQGQAGPSHPSTPAQPQACLPSGLCSGATFSRKAPLVTLRPGLSLQASLHHTAYHYACSQDAQQVALGHPCAALGPSQLAGGWV